MSTTNSLHATRNAASIMKGLICQRGVLLIKKQSNLEGIEILNPLKDLQHYCNLILYNMVAESRWKHG